MRKHAQKAIINHLYCENWENLETITRKDAEYCLAIGQYLTAYLQYFIDHSLSDVFLIGASWSKFVKFQIDWICPKAHQPREVHKFRVRMTCMNTTKEYILFLHSFPMFDEESKLCLQLFSKELHSSEIAPEFRKNKKGKN